VRWPDAAPEGRRTPGGSTRTYSTCRFGRA
jgi:hypothetical protein